MLQWDFIFLRILAFASQTIKKINYNIYILITYFNFTQLLFWILALLDFSFPAAVKNLFCILFVYCHLHISYFLCLFTCPTHSCTYLCSLSFHFCTLSSSFPFPYTFIQPYSPICFLLYSVPCSFQLYNSCMYGSLLIKTKITLNVS